MSEAEVKVAILEEAVKDLKAEVRDARKEQSVIISNMVECRVKVDDVEKRLVKHSARHENNYKELSGQFEVLKGELSKFKGSVLSRLDKMVGRDSILKLLFGGLVGAVVGGLVLAVTLKVMGI